MDADKIKDILLKANFSIKSLKNGPTVIFEGNKQFYLFLKKDKLIAKEKKLFALKYVIDLQGLD